jgi:hypothetical protein
VIVCAPRVATWKDWIRKTIRSSIPTMGCLPRPCCRREGRLTRLTQPQRATIPDFFHFYADRANMLQEKWFGRPGELARYTQSLLSSPGREDGQIAYTYVAGRLSAQYTRENIFEKTGLIWPLLDDAYLTRDRLYGLRSTDLNIWLNYAIAANDIAVAAELVARIGGDWDRSVWGSKDAFDAAVLKALQTQAAKKGIVY